MDDYRIQTWLGYDERGLHYMVHFLTLRFAVQPGALARLREQVIPRLEQEPEYWRFVIEKMEWRSQIIGCYAALAALKTSFLPAFLSALTPRFDYASFVCPQVAVTYGLLHPDEARAFFEAYLAGPAVMKDAKLTGAAHRVLVKLGSPIAQSFDIRAYDANPPPDASVSHWHMNCDIGEGVVEAHWEAWRKILAETNPT